MGQPRIVEIQYHEFLKILERASISKNKIEPAEKEAWKAYVRKHNIPEAGMGVKARSGTMSGETKGVIIDGLGADDGYYLYAPDDMFCLKYDLGLD